MRTVVAYQLISLDGVAEEPGDWMVGVDDTFLANLGTIIGTQDTVLLGRGTYDYWAGYWPTADVQPFADFINGVPKHVFTSRPVTADWAGTTVVTEPAEAHVARLKQGTGGDIGIHGSIDLTRSLLRAGVVDELRLAVSPATAGRGRRLFGDDTAPQSFDLVDVERTATGVLLLSYRADGSTTRDRR